MGILYASILYAAGMFAVSVLASPAAAQQSRVESIRMHLFREGTGTLSDDIVANNPGLWNVIIGEQQANSFLVSVVVSGKPQSYDRDGTLTVTVYDDERKKRVVQRRFRGFLFGKDGRTYKPLLVDDLTCTRVRIVARTRGGAKSETVTFKCGE
jgi:hypothetical protein